MIGPWRIHAVLPECDAMLGGCYGLRVNGMLFVSSV
jgi:hypothetical protein